MIMFKTLLIDGMHCNLCVGILNIELYKIKEVVNVKIEFSNKKAIIRLTSVVPKSLLRNAVEKAGYNLINII